MAVPASRFHQGQRQQPQISPDVWLQPLSFRRHRVGASQTGATMYEICRCWLLRLPCLQAKWPTRYGSAMRCRSISSHLQQMTPWLPQNPSLGSSHRRWPVRPPPGKTPKPAKGDQFVTCHGSRFLGRMVLLALVGKTWVLACFRLRAIDSPGTGSVRDSAHWPREDK